MAAWIAVHPFKNDTEKPLWPNLSYHKSGSPISYAAARQILQRRCKIANLSKRVYLNLFRHSEATSTAIMAAIPWAQAFFDGNRRTSIIAAGTFLRDNGYELDISPEEENTELREMLSEIKKHQHDLEPTIMRQLFLYISERINKYEPKT